MTELSTFTHDGKTYHPKMTRAGVRAAEEQGLSTSQMTDKPFTALNLLFFAALYSGYKVNPGKAAAILDDRMDSGEIEFESTFEELATAYSELFSSGGSETEEASY